MGPDEVIQRLKGMGISSSRATLLRYKEAGLIPKPEEGAGGRGVGRFSDYPSETVSDYFASYHLIKGKHASQEQAAVARMAAKKMKGDFADEYSWYCYDSTREIVWKHYRGKHAEGEIPSNSVLADFARSENLQGPADCFEIGSLSCFDRFLSVRFAVDWWELSQIANSEIDNSYVYFCQRVKWGAAVACRGDIDGIDHRINRLTNQIELLFHDLQELVALRDDGNPKGLTSLGRWLALYKIHPNLQLMIRSAMLANYRKTSPAVFDLLTTGKLPEV